MDTPVNVGQGSNTQFMDAYKAQAEMNLGFINALLSASEHVRAVQLEAARETEAQIGRLAQQIRDAQTFQDLVTVQSAFCEDCRRAATNYWTNIAQLAQQTQKDMVARAQETCTRPFSQALPTNFDIPAGAPMQAFTTMLEKAYKTVSDANAAMFKTIGATDAPVKVKVQEAS